MNECQFCREPLPPGALVCGRCGQAQLRPGRYHVLISIPAAGLALMTGIAYWALSQLIWLPAARVLFYSIAELINLKYRLGELPSQSILNAPWLLGGAAIYIALEFWIARNYGFRRAAATGLLLPGLFAFLDAWTWSAAEPPGILQIVPVIAVSLALMAIANSLVVYWSRRWPVRLSLFEARRLPAGPSRTRGLTPSASSSTPTQELPTAAPPARPAARPAAPAIQSDADRTERLPELGRASGVNESTPPALNIAAEEGNDEPTLAGLPAWVIVLALAVVLITGIILVLYALRAGPA